MDRRRFLLTSLAGALAAPSAARAQQVGEVYRIGLLEGRFPPISDIAARERCGALIVSNDYVGRLSAYRIIAGTRAKRIPALYTSGVWWVKTAGGLMAYGVDELHHLRGLAVYVDKILKDAKPADLPVEQPTKFEFVINLKTAKALGLTIPPSLLARADQVIE